MCCVEVDTTVSLVSLKKPVAHGSAEVSYKTLLVGKGQKVYEFDHENLIVYGFLTLNCFRESHIDVSVGNNVTGSQRFCYCHSFVFELYLT